MLADKKHKVLELKGITKRFGGVVALNNVDFELWENEIVALVGDNGAGKSTLIKIISGIHIPNKGEIYIDGEKVNIREPKDAKDLGIETIYQELALFDNLNPSANIFAGREEVVGGIGRLIGWLDQKKMDQEAKMLLDNLGINIPDLRSEVQRFSGGQRQSIALSRSIKWGKKIVIMDEPTAALGVRESQKTLELIKKMIGKVKGMIVISHNIEHVLGVANRVVVLRSGKCVGNVNIADYDNSEKLHSDLVMMITGIKTN